MGAALTDGGWRTNQAPASPSIDMRVGLIVDSKLPVVMVVPERGHRPRQGVLRPTHARQGREVGSFTGK